MNETPIRIRVLFSKVGDLRFTGHIDLQRLFERALRRSALPIRYSQGFSPKVRLNLASALPLGYSSQAELLDFWMNEPVSLPELQSVLASALPLELQILDVQEVPNQLPSLQASLIASDFSIHFPPEVENQVIKQGLDELLSKDYLEVDNRGKTRNFRSMILNTEWLDVANVLNVRLTATPGNTGRPDDLVRFLGIDPLDCDFERTKLIFGDGDGR
ncbi:MAG TPA: TIGR03936 family radical SAM-associated protein [Anaerolineaceae bacterium]|nr:TIGR03936 family radical SAM-associated protein [Anaerolineaceae bacterium]